MFINGKPIIIITGADIFWMIVIVIALIVFGTCALLDWNTRRKRNRK